MKRTETRHRNKSMEREKKETRETSYLEQWMWSVEG